MTGSRISSESDAIFTIDNLPFTIGVYDEPANPQPFPSMLPLQLGISISTGLVSQLPSEIVRRFLALAYARGSLLGTAMDDTPAGRRYAEDFLAFLREVRDPNGASVLEIGAGRGYLLRRLQDLGAKVLGVEPGLANADNWKTHRVPVVGEFFPTPQITEHFDLIIGFALLEHVEQLGSFLDSVHRQLEPQGCAIFAVPDCGQFIAQGDPSMLLHEHWHYFTAHSLKEVLRAAGFRIVHQRPAGYGSVLYMAATPTRDPRPIGSVSDEIQQARQFAAKCARLRAWASNRIESLAQQGVTLGVFVPGRALALLPPHSDVRFFDDDAELLGRYFPPFHRAVENRKALLQCPVDELWILSRSFGPRLASELGAAGELNRTRIRTIVEIAGEASNEVAV